MRWVLVVSTWWFALGATFNLAAAYSVGPVVYVWDRTNNHGLHLSDALFFAFACYWAYRVTRALLAEGH